MTKLSQASSTAVSAATTYPAIVGMVLQKLRERAGFDQAKLAEALGITQSAWSKIERGISPLTLEQLTAACAKLRVTPLEVFSYAEKAKAQFETQGIKVTPGRMPQEIDSGLVLISLAAVGLLIAAVLGNSK